MWEIGSTMRYRPRSGPPVAVIVEQRVAGTKSCIIRRAHPLFDPAGRHQGAWDDWNVRMVPRGTLEPLGNDEA